MLAKLIDCVSTNALASHRWALKAAGGTEFFTANRFDGHPGIKNLSAYIACQGSGWAALQVIRANVLLPSETTTRTHMQRGNPDPLWSSGVSPPHIQRCLQLCECRGLFKLLPLGCPLRVILSIDATDLKVGTG